MIIINSLGIWKLGNMTSKERNRENQAAYIARRLAAGDHRSTNWFPGDVYEFLEAQKAAGDIPTLDAGIAAAVRQSAEFKSYQQKKKEIDQA